MRGKAQNRENIIELLKPFLKLGMSVNKACDSAGIPQSTVATWILDDEELRLKIAVWQREVNNLSYESWKKRIVEGDYQAAKDWLERKEKDEFSLRNEVTGKDGEAIEMKYNTLNDEQLEQTIKQKASEAGVTSSD